jgi:hypothetical protein
MMRGIETRYRSDAVQSCRGISPELILAGTAGTYDAQTGDYNPLVHGMIS